MNISNTETQRLRKFQIFDLSVLASLRLIFFIFIFNYGIPVFSQDNRIFQTTKVRKIIDKRGEADLKFIKPSGILTSQISRIVSIEKVKKDTIYCNVNRREFENFLKLNLNFEVIEDPVRYTILKSTGSIWDWDKYPTYSEYVAMMDSFARAYPSLCRIIETGKSVKDHSILFARISSDTTILKPKVMYSSTIHGNETGGYVQMLRLINYLLSEYNSNPAVTILVDSLEIWINPLANPDGTYKGGDNTVFLAGRRNADSADLNRNFPDPVMGNHPDGYSYQPETNAMMDLTNKNHFVLSANFHAGDEVVNYPWDSQEAMHPDSTWFRYISQEYADSAHIYGRSGYFTDVRSSGIVDGYDWYAVYGGRQDYMTFFKQGREVTIELDQNYVTSESELNNLWNYNYRSFLHYLEQAMYGIRGIITDSVSHNPIRAEVELTQHDSTFSTVYSDSLSGKYYRLIDAGTYNIRFSAPGYFTKEIQNVSVNNRQETWLDVALVSGTKSGTVKTSKLNLAVFPNPCENYFQINNLETQLKNVEILITDISGKNVRRLLKVNPNKPIFVYDLSSGIYYLTIKTNSKLYRTKLIIER